MAYNKISWLDSAVSEIKYVPDRKAVEKELSDHIEDKTEALIAAGIPKTIAGKRAIEAMGDPVEIGKALNKAHSPFLGRLYSITKFLAVVLVVITLISAAANRSDLSYHFPLIIKSNMFTMYRFEQEYCYDVSVPEEFKVGAFTVEPTGAQVYDTGDGYMLSVDLKVRCSLMSGHSPSFMAYLADGDKMVKIGLYMANGGFVDYVNSVMVQKEPERFDSEKLWDAWYFNIRVYGVSPGSTETIDCALNDELSMRFEL